MATRHTTGETDSIPSIAAQYGFFDATLWDHPDNADLKKLRGNPNVLRKGDVVFIPDLVPKHVAGATGKRHVFRRKGIPAVFRLQMFAAEQPRAEQDYVFEIGEESRRGRTDDQGMMTEFVPPGITRAKLIIGPDQQVLELRFGELDPSTETTGIQQRLNNLGFRCSVTGEIDAGTNIAVSAFQERMGLTVTGAPDAATVEKLVQLHDITGGFPPRGE